MSDFVPLEIEHGPLVDLSGDAFPTRVAGWRDGWLGLEGGATHYGMVVEGACALETEAGSFGLRAGMFWVVPGQGIVRGGAGLVVSRLGYRGLFQVGGPVEAEGRLRYIDGCSDTLLVCPPALGEPCLNHLHMPPGTDQTAHTHPSERIGVIVRGSGECRTPGGTWALRPGMGWRIPTGCLHSFFTRGEALDVLAWHPDSDFGPTHDHHPMVNRTYVRGVAATEIDEIRTREG
ncbi:MAG: cupin domain-containing protein [Gemmatimonadota bacterium]